MVMLIANRNKVLYPSWMQTFMSKTKEGLHNLLRERIAALRGARSLA